MPAITALKEPSKPPVQITNTPCTRLRVFQPVQQSLLAMLGLQIITHLKIALLVTTKTERVSRKDVLFAPLAISVLVAPLLT